MSYNEDAKSLSGSRRSLLREASNEQAEASGTFLTADSQTPRTATSGRRMVKLQVKNPDTGLRGSTSFSRQKGSESKQKMKVEVHTRQGNVEVDKPKPKVLEDVINLETLMQLKTAFMRADKDGGGDLSIEEFVNAFSGILG
eukprot:CAMPEP_0118952710 /NCGR_PEP_ID=MMETSP1169-20130426/55329_1 /TAXON_ID=36882 /ORGANISM="Pyramimonas obovata, Strain CCMP722" /LENGTH=141 /DNA_ID=CAMNT_0006900027 /DNA_START=376 /DNA_END=797 /DNA_ORIENTATION=-